MSQIFPSRDLETLRFISNAECFKNKYNKKLLDKNLTNNKTFKNIENLSKIYEKNNGLLLINTFSTSGAYQGRLIND